MSYKYPKDWNANLSEENILIRIKHLHKTIECGLHSGFPACCVKFYACDWMWMNHLQATVHRKKMFEKAEQLGIASFGYIVCPACLEKGRHVEVKPCPNGANCWHADECAGDKNYQPKP